MINIPTWKIVLVIFVCLLGFANSAPNLLPTQTVEHIRQNYPSWIPTNTINLGLDLQGGAHLLVEPEFPEVIEERIESLSDSIDDLLKENDIRRDGRIKEARDNLSLKIKDTTKLDEATRAINRMEDGLNISTEGNTLNISFTDEALEDIRTKVIEQSIEIIRRRIDETGTKEPAILRQGDNRILIQFPGISDTVRLKELIGSTAKLSFHLVSDSSRNSLTTMTLPMAESEGGLPLTIKATADISGDMLTNAQAGFDQSSQAVVNFQLNTIGAKRFCKVSSENIGKRFAIVLDEEIISAPVFRGAICAGQAQISGSFDVASANDLALLLRAGALPASLKFVEERSVGPSLGADSVEAGKKASLIALLLVLLFMAVKYRLFGFYADIALVINVSLIFALLSMLQATLTLPGIAGIVLTIGMAVDANVLIFERIKEELRNGRSPLAAVDTGYSRAFGTIIDANLTTLIAAAILYSFGTGPVKGFAVTLGLGVLTSLFTAIMVTRLFVVLWIKYKKPKELKV